MASCVCREIRAEKEKQRIIRNGRNKFNTNPKDVSLALIGWSGKEKGVCVCVCIGGRGKTDREKQRSRQRETIRWLTHSTAGDKVPPVSESCRWVCWGDSRVPSQGRAAQQASYRRLLGRRVRKLPSLFIRLDLYLCRIRVHVRVYWKLFRLATMLVHVQLTSSLTSYYIVCTYNLQ